MKNQDHENFNTFYNVPGDSSYSKNFSNGQRRIFILDDEQAEGVKEINFREKNTGFGINLKDRRENNCEVMSVKNRKLKGVNGFGKPFLENVTEEHDSPSSSSANLASTFFKKSSIYALNQIGNSNTVRRKVFWAFILIGGIIGCCSQVARYLNAYYKYPVVINIDSVSQFNQEFPGVTICNLNTIREAYFPCVLRKEEHDSCNLSDTMTPSSLEEAVNWPQPDCFRQANPSLSDEFVEKMQFTSLYFSLSDESKIKFGHQASDFIKSCSFNGEECSYTNFTIHLDRTYGNCFTFNKANSSKEPFKTSYIGPNSGLTLELDVESKHYTWLTQSVGARAVIHDPYQEPNPDDQGINISPGFETTLGLSKVMMRRLESPYKDHCMNYERSDSKRQCDSACSQTKISWYCSCSLKSMTDTQACDLSNMTELCCVYLEGHLEKEYNATCDCPLECESSSYEMKISGGVWPANSENLGQQYRKLPVDDIRETFLKLKIYFDTLEQLTYEQKPMFEESEVLSQIGGQMGLWLGLSLAAMFECLENIVLFWHYRNRKVISPQDKTSNTRRGF